MLLKSAESSPPSPSPFIWIGRVQPLIRRPSCVSLIAYGALHQSRQVCTPSGGELATTTALNLSITACCLGSRFFSVTFALCISPQLHLFHLSRIYVESATYCSDRYTSRTISSLGERFSATPSITSGDADWDIFLDLPSLASRPSAPRLLRCN